MIMNGKDMDTNELVQQLELENVIKDRWTMFLATHGNDQDQVNEIDIEPTLQGRKILRIH
jgi:hypothetical protein